MNERLCRRGVPAAVAGSVVLIVALVLFAGLGPAGAATTRIVPATGTYSASGSGDPASYDLHAQVRRSGGRRTISVQVQDSCGGFATSTHVPIGHDPKGLPNFTVQLGAVSVTGRWTNPTTIKGTVKTPCARKQGYLLRKAG